jgi:hypothetical protein
MTRDEVIALAREAGIYYRDEYEFCEIDRDGVPMEMMAKFAALVAAAEREECARLCEETARHNEEVGCDIDLLIGNMECAAAIRARGESK